MDKGKEISVGVGSGKVKIDGWWWGGGGASRYENIPCPFNLNCIFQ
jgi:hypothetical protein